MAMILNALAGAALLLGTPTVVAEEKPQKPDAAAEAPSDFDGEGIMEALGVAPDPDELREAIRAAQAHPLGSRRNPVRVGGPSGEHAYIARLRCADGQRPEVGNRSNNGIGVFGSIVDVYPLDCGEAAPGRTSLYMDMYHSRHNETGAPPGFTLVPR